MRQQLILVVDDEPAIVRLVQTALLADGYAVINTGRGEEALMLLEDERPDLVVLDLMMPEIDGSALLNRLRAIGQVPIILLSDRADDRLMGSNDAVDAYLTPPFDPDELSALVAKILPRSARSTAPAEGRMEQHSLEIDPDFAWHIEESPG